MKINDDDRKLLQPLQQEWLTANDYEFIEASHGLAFALGEESPTQARLVLEYLTPVRITHVLTVLRGLSDRPVVALSNDADDYEARVCRIADSLSRVHSEAVREHRDAT